MATMGRNSLEIIRRAALPALALLIIANLLGYAIVGSNGVLSWGDYRRQEQEKQVELASLNTERARLEHRGALLDPRVPDPDLDDEFIRGKLGLVRPDELIIP